MGAVRYQTRGQSNLLKAALNASHTLHALDSITIAIPKICRGLQNLKVAQVTQTHMTCYCIGFIGPPAIYRHTKCQFCSLSHFGDTRDPKVKN